MSVGVCIINKNGIALAADSAGTLKGNRMFYNSLNKLYSLSSIRQIGALTYGDSTLCGVSINQILKEFKLHIDSLDNFERFENIVDLFKEFIKKKSQYYKFGLNENQFIPSMIKSLVDEWGNKIKNVIKSDADFLNDINGVINNLDIIISQSIKIVNFDVSSYIEIEYQNIYNERVNLIVPELNKFLEQKDHLWKLICKYFNLPLQVETDNKVGIAFAGYGREDAFPKYINIEILNIINGELKLNVIVYFHESNIRASVYALAQSEVVMTFFKGISDSITNYIKIKIGEIVEKKKELLPKDIDESKHHLITNIFDSIENDLMNAIANKIQKDNVSPILTSLNNLPLPEMSFLAENLVNITSLKRTYAIDGNQQTVGGPTDSAIITKADGFVWVKEKISMIK
ncbi:MAG: hypothetical protein PHF05_07705 [Candidatus Izemoplasmatales bacterium]|nr:hypothetical protein [Candidatus Izemoplasmatales bacterium]